MHTTCFNGHLYRGVSAQGVCLPGGCVCLEGVSSGCVSSGLCPKGVSTWGVSRGVYPGGVCPGDVHPQTQRQTPPRPRIKHPLDSEVDTPLLIACWDTHTLPMTCWDTPPEQNDWQTGVKHYLLATSFARGNKKILPYAGNSLDFRIRTFFWQRTAMQIEKDEGKRNQYLTNKFTTRLLRERHFHWIYQNL